MMSRLPPTLRKFQETVQKTAKDLQSNVHKQTKSLKNMNLQNWYPSQLRNRLPTTNDFHIHLKNISNSIQSNANYTKKRMQSQMSDFQSNQWPMYKQQVMKQSMKIQESSQKKWQELQPTLNKNTKYMIEKYPIIKKSIEKTQEISKNMSQKSSSVTKNTKKISEHTKTGVKSLESSLKSISSVSKQSLNILSNIPKNIEKEAKRKYSNYQRLMAYLRSRPKEWKKNIKHSYQSVRISILTYCVLGISMFMMVNHSTYISLVYIIRHRYDAGFLQKHPFLASNMKILCVWMNVPYVQYSETQLEEKGTETVCKSEDGKSENEGNTEVVILSESTMRENNIITDMKLVDIAYRGLFYPRIFCTLLLTFGIGSPFLRIWIRFKK